MDRRLVKDGKNQRWISAEEYALHKDKYILLDPREAPPEPDAPAPAILDPLPLSARSRPKMGGK